MLAKEFEAFGPKERLETFSDRSVRAVTWNGSFLLYPCFVEEVFCKDADFFVSGSGARLEDGLVDQIHVFF